MPPRQTVQGRLWRLGGLLLVAIVLIFCHPCHGEDVDDELSVPVVEQKSESPSPFPSSVAE